MLPITRPSAATAAPDSTPTPVDIPGGGGSAASDEQRAKRALFGRSDFRWEANRARLSKLLIFLVSVIGGIGVWYIVALLKAGNGLIPTPYAVLVDGIQLAKNGQLFSNAKASLLRIAIGYSLAVVVAIPLGFLIGWYARARAFLDPWIQFLRMIPGLAWIPLVILLLGIGESAKIWLIFFGSMLACTVSIAGGVRSIDRTLIRAARVLGASDRTLFWRIVVPGSLPYTFVGMRIALGNAWATLVAAELIAAHHGLGVMMSNAAQYFQVSTIFVGLISIGFLGLLMDRIIVLADNHFTNWQERKD
jgi:NitT/TauT family transport system permease protein